jgi:hypothetical protein
VKKSPGTSWGFFHRPVAHWEPNGGYRPRWIAIVAIHVTAAAAINTKNGLSVGLVDFAMTIPDRS